MGQKEKLINRLKARPKDFTFEEAERLLAYLRYKRYNKGRTSGSRVMFVRQDCEPILFHKPHPSNRLDEAVVRYLLRVLEREGLV